MAELRRPLFRDMIGSKLGIDLNRRPAAQLRGLSQTLRGVVPAKAGTHGKYI
jgi:hypothetical protein